jgi:hypothetical protein
VHLVDEVLALGLGPSGGLGGFAFDLLARGLFGLLVPQLLGESGERVDELSGSDGHGAPFESNRWWKEQSSFD